MTEEIKNRLSNIGEAIGTIALEYIVGLEKENEKLQKNNKHIQDLIEAERQRQEECNNVHLRDIATLKKESEQLKVQFDKLLDFVAERVEECDVCELTDTCINSEGVCPFAWSDRNIKDLIIKHINRSSQNE